MVEKRISYHEIAMWSPEWEDYFGEVLRNGKASPLAGLPKRTYTEWFDDKANMQVVVRYEEAN